uniref:Uncharacterized protein n=1 Tax=Oryza brachyantha TaxID=4533 RepID=J3L9N7_ORYBR
MMCSLSKLFVAFTMSVNVRLISSPFPLVIIISECSESELNEDVSTSPLSSLLFLVMKRVLLCETKKHPTNKRMPTLPKKTPKDIAKMVFLLCCFLGSEVASAELQW